MRTSFEREIRKEHRDLKQSLHFLYKQYEEMVTKCTHLEKENNELKAQNVALVAEQGKLRNLAVENDKRTTALEQYSHNKNIELINVPNNPDEKLAAILGKRGEAVGEPIEERDVDVCHRVPAKENPFPHIVVQFHNRSKRDAVLEKARKMRLSATDVGLSETSPIYVNEHLCPRLKKLLGMTVAKKKEMCWLYAWTRGGKIFARKTETSGVLHITSSSDLEKIV